MKTITINVPDDCEVKIIKKKGIKEPIVRTYQDLVDNKFIVNGFKISEESDIFPTIGVACVSDRNIFRSEKIAKLALAMAMISQLMCFYGGEITDKEWEDPRIEKYILTRGYSNIIVKDNVFCDYSFLAFHTAEQRDDFLKYNKQLVKDYLMID